MGRLCAVCEARSRGSPLLCTADVARQRVRVDRCTADWSRTCRCFRPCLYLSRVVPPLTQTPLFRPQHKRVVRHSMPAQRYARGSTFSSIVVDRHQKARYRRAFQDAKVRWWLRLARLAERVAMQGRAGGETEEQSAHRCTPECAALPSVEAPRRASQSCLPQGSLGQPCGLRGPPICVGAT